MKEVKMGMVQIPKRGKPSIPFLSFRDVEDGDLATIIEPPYVQTAEKSKFGKERTILTIKLLRTGEIYRFGLNTTTNDRLVDAFSSEGNLWRDKQIKILKRSELVLGKDRYVLYAIPSVQTKIGV
jgi:hypothetical protein